MKSREETETKTIYECGVCGYSSYDGDLGKKLALEHEEKHGQSVPFKVDDKVIFWTTEYETEHGSPHASAHGQYHDGLIVKFAPEDPYRVEHHDPEWDPPLQTEGEEYALIEEDDGERQWVGVWDLKKWMPPEPEKEPERGELNTEVEGSLGFHSGGMF